MNLRQYTRYECGILKLVVESGLNVYSFLSMRAVCKEGLSGLLALEEELGGGVERDERRGETRRLKNNAGDQGGAVYRSGDFRNLYNLVAQEEHLQAEDWFLRTLIAAFLLKLLMVTK